MKTAGFLSRVPDKKLVALFTAIGIIFLVVGLYNLENHVYESYRICGSFLIAIVVVHAWPERNT